MFKLSVVVLNTIMEGTLSQISFLGQRSNLMQFRKLGFQRLQLVYLVRAMRYPVSKNINEKYHFFISRLDYYSIWSDNIRQLEAIDSHRSQLFNDIS